MAKRRRKTSATGFTLPPYLSYDPAIGSEMRAQQRGLQDVLYDTGQAGTYAQQDYQQKLADIARSGQRAQEDLGFARQDIGFQRQDVNTGYGRNVEDVRTAQQRGLYDINRTETRGLRDIGLGYTRGMHDIGRSETRGLEDIATNYKRGNEDISTEYERGKQDFSNQLTNLIRQFQVQGREQRQTANAAGTLPGGSFQQASNAVRAENEAIARKPIDIGMERLGQDVGRARGRLSEDTTRNKTRLLEDTSWARKVLGEDTANKRGDLLQDTAYARRVLGEDTTRNLSRLLQDRNTSLSRLTTAEGRLNVEGRRIAEDLARDSNLSYTDLTRALAELATQRNRAIREEQVGQIDLTQQAIFDAQQRKPSVLAKK